MKHLKKLYPNIKKPDYILKEKDIIYFMRSNTGSDKESKISKETYSKEIFELVKLKEWDWNYTDIDGCNLLTYPLWTQDNIIADYLIENKYNLSEYTKVLSDALGASVRLYNYDYFHKIFSNPKLHPDYRLDLTIRVLEMDKAVPNLYLDLKTLVLSQEEVQSIEFNRKIIEKTLQKSGSTDFFITLLYTLPVEPQLKIDIVNEIFTKTNEAKFTNRRKEFDKWVLNYKLEQELFVKPSGTTNKI